MADTPSPRLASIDAYRGFVMFLMLAEVLHLGAMASIFPDSELWMWLGWHQSHIAWTGCTLHDLIQPSFTFLVGIALPFSLASRLAKGQSFLRSALHALIRSGLLILLGVALRSFGRPITNWTFEDTLTQIGLGYFFLFLLGYASQRMRWIVLAGILIGYWALFALYPLPGPDFDYAAVGVQPDAEINSTGLAAHWNKNTNAAWAFDTWFLNLFTRTKEFTHNGGGYATLSFIPTLATMIFGLIAGTWLRDVKGEWSKVARLAIVGVGLLALGWGLGRLGICPVVKKIWTPTWTIFSAGWCMILMALFHALSDAIGYRGWSYPLRVIGANSIFAYCISHVLDSVVFSGERDAPVVISAIQTHLGKDIFQFAGSEYAPLVTGAAVLLVYWLMLFWLYRQRIFIRL